MTMKEAGKSCVVWAFLFIFKLRESTHSKTGNANVHERTHDALLQHIQSVDISSCAWHTAPSVLCMREGSLDRNVRGQDIPTGEQIFSLKSSVQWCNQHKKKMSSFHSLLLLAPVALMYSHTHTRKKQKQKKNGVPATSVPSKVSKGSGWGGRVVLEVHWPANVCEWWKASQTFVHNNIKSPSLSPLSKSW